MTYTEDELRAVLDGVLPADEVDWTAAVYRRGNEQLSRIVVVPDPESTG